MDDFDIYLIARKSIKGVVALVSRTFVIQLLAIASQFILAAYLDTASFGVFLIVSSLVSLLTYFQDIGLAASLIQKKEEPTKAALRSVFTVQQLLVLCITIPTLVFGRQIASFYHLNDAGYWLLVSFVVSFFFSSLRTIPSVLLERHLEFGKLVLPQIVENFFYYGSLILFAVMGFGITTFTIAVFLRSITGLIVLYIIRPWPIGFAWERDVLKTLLSFGIPFQANSLLALCKDDLLNLFIGRILPLSQVGYVGFSQKWAFTPLRLVMDNVVKITFSSYSRLQHDKHAMRIAIEKSLFLISALLFPASIGIVLIAPFFITYIPRYHKWEPALISLFFFSINALVASTTTPITNVLNAIGKVKITLYFMSGWTICTWVATIIGIHYFSFNGVSIASALVAVSSLFVIAIARKYIYFSFFKPIYRQLLASCVMGVFLLLVQPYITSLFDLLLQIVCAAILYAGVFFLLARREMISTSRFIFQSMRGSYE